MNARPDPVLFLAVTPSMRGLIENVIEDLLLLLDEIDGDENLEPDLAGFDHRFMDDREGDDDFEPSIGSPNDLEHDDAEGRAWALLGFEADMRDGLPSLAVLASEAVRDVAACSRERRAA